jgi:hypothetical protein
MLSRDRVTIEEVWIDYWIYWTFTRYKGYTVQSLCLPSPIGAAWQPLISFRVQRPLSSLTGVYLTNLTINYGEREGSGRRDRAVGGSERHYIYGGRGINIFSLLF